ncbi:MAG: hypothetical protein Tsb0032_00410 [Kiloniellaceae bacterium]
MPRIPSAADVTPRTASASRLPTVRAEAEAFGLDVAAGLQDFAGGLTDFGPFLEKVVAAEERTETAEGVAQAALHRAELREAAHRIVEDWAFDGGSPRDAASKASRELAAVEDRRLKRVPPGRRAALKAASHPIRQGLLLRVAQRAQNQRVARLSRQAAQALHLLQEQAVREPDAAAHYVDEGRAQLLALRDAGALTAEQYEAQEEDFRRKLYTLVIRGRPAARALMDLADGVYDEALADPGLKRLLERETAWRAESEKAETASAVETELARLRRGGPSETRSATSQRPTTPEQSDDSEDRADRVRQVRFELQSLRFAPEAEIQRHVGAIAADASRSAEIRQEVWLQSQMMLRDRHADPAAYVMELPAVAEAFAAAEREPNLLAEAIAARLAAQAAMQVPPEERNALTLAERERILGGLRRMAPEQRLVALTELGRTYGRQSGAVAADLAERGLPVGEVLAADPSCGLDLAERLARAGEGRPAPGEGGLVDSAVEERLAADDRASA